MIAAVLAAVAVLFLLLIWNFIYCAQTALGHWKAGNRARAVAGLLAMAAPVAVITWAWATADLSQF